MRILKSFNHKNHSSDKIAGGDTNTINAASDWSAIGGGQLNVIGTPVNGAQFAVIGGGTGNSATGGYSAILGGSGNSDSGIPFTGMYGNGLAAALFTAPAPIPPSAFWVDTLVAPNIPVITSIPAYMGLPPGALYTTAPTGSGYMASPVYVA